MENQELLENLFKLQDYNKSLRLNATTEEQIEQLNRIDTLIDEMLKKIYVHV